MLDDLERKLKDKNYPDKKIEKIFWNSENRATALTLIKKYRPELAKEISRIILKAATENV